jgi:glycosyltransferase involved in cell wall biosynthesis
MPSGANCDLFRPMPAEECRSRLHFDLDKKYIGFAGTLLKHQGIDILFDAAPSILSIVPEVRFIIIGEGPIKELCMREVECRGLSAYFMFTGQVDYQDMPIWIGAMDICVAPFLCSAGLRSPVKIFDYMACGKPVVASRIEGTTDMFDSSGAIKLVSPGDAQELSDAIIDLLSNRETAARMGQKGRKFILEKYDRKSMATMICAEAVSCKR